MLLYYAFKQKQCSVHPLSKIVLSKDCILGEERSVLVEEGCQVLLHGSGPACELLSAGGAAAQLWLGLTHLTHQVAIGTLHDPGDRDDGEMWLIST